MLLDYFKMRKQKLEEMNEIVKRIEQKVENNAMGISQLEKNFGRIKNELEPVCQYVEKETENEREMENSLWNVMLKKGVQLFLIAGITVSSWIGIDTYLKPGKYTVAVLNYVSVYVVLGITVIGVVLVIELLGDIFIRDRQKVGDFSLLRQGVIVSIVVRKIQNIKSSIPHKKHKGCLEKKIVCEEKRKRIASFKKEITCIIAWLIIGHFMCQVIICVYVILKAQRYLGWIMIGLLSYVSQMIIIDIRSQILKREYTYIYNMATFIIAFVSLLIALKPTLIQWIQMLNLQ